MLLPGTPHDKCKSTQFTYDRALLVCAKSTLPGGTLLSKRELGSGSELFSQLAVDPLDSRQMCLCGSNGAVAVLQLHDPAADKIQLQQYRVNLQQSTGANKRVPPREGGGG